MNKLLAIVALLIGTAAAQNFTRVTAYTNKFLGCVSANSNYKYCSDGFCYNGTANASLTCSKSFDNDYANPIYPATYQISYNINQLDIVPLKINGSNTWLNLKIGESVRLNMKSTAEKSAYVDLVYNSLNGGSNNQNKTINKNVQFLVFNNRLKDVRKFDVTRVDTVLLPQSADDFTVYLAARDADFNITVLASQSVFGRAISLGLAMIAVAFGMLM